MKNILSEKKTAIILLLVTVIFLAFYTIILTRPISYGLKYHNETVYMGSYFEGTLTFHRNGRMTIDNSSFGEPVEAYYYCKDGYMFSLMATTEEEREEEIALIDEEFEDALANFFPTRINAFVNTSKGINPELHMTYACKSIFVFAVIGGILAIAMAGFTWSSFALSIKAKRNNGEVAKSKADRKEVRVKSGYKEQQNLSFIQLLSETPSFIATLASAIATGTLLVFVDLLDSFGNLLRASMVTIISQKLSKGQNNDGVGRLEAIVSLICDGIMLFSFLITLGLSLYSIIFPELPSGLVIAVVGLKTINVCFDTAFFVEQRKIVKTHSSPISETNFAAALASLLFDSITLVSLFVMWLLRNNPIGGYISPVISIVIAIYLIGGCIRRAVRMINELTNKPLMKSCK